MSEAVFRYKAELMERTEFYFDTKIALTVIPESELYDIGTQYNPGPLIMSEMLNIEGVQIALAIKRYKNRVTVALRCCSGHRDCRRNSQFLWRRWPPLCSWLSNR
jgi:hypothetical protein